MKRLPITMPVLSDTMTSGHLLNWQKQIGDLVNKGDILAEAESDKAVMDIEAFDDGYLAGPLLPPGSDVPVGTVIAYLADTPEAALAGDSSGRPPEADPVSQASAEEAPDARSGTQQEMAQASLHVAVPASARGRAGVSHRASPYARGLARELGIDLAWVRPGEGGVISSREVLAAALDGPLPDLSAGPPFRYRLLTPMRRAVARNMSNTLRTPVFHVSAEIPTQALKQAAHARKQSFTLLLARAAALSVTKNPGFNMAYTPVGLAVRERVDVGIAVDIPAGLVTPVLRDAAGLDMEELAEQWRILREKIKRQRLMPADYEGATFYVSNMGMFPVVRGFDAIVPTGAAAILAVGASHDGEAQMTLGCDHRVVYGADAARFLETLETYLREPEDWL
jgi:pyruvate dehydrogenase E2 component (dihydrolipoamide acetyltransferase)